MLKIVLSDLHIGAGGVDNPLEDFRHDDEFIALLDDLIDESEASNREIELILNGDIFEFWQVPALQNPGEYVPGGRYRNRLYLATDELSAVRRMRVIVAGHRPLFEALADFISPRRPRRRITIVRGNHDLQLHWPGVQGVIEEALAARGDRAGGLQFVERTIERDGVYIEHGSQYADPLSRHPHFDDPRHPRRPKRLRETPGFRISVRAVNRLERVHPWVSSVKPLTAIFWFLLRFDTLSAIRLAVRMLRHLPTLLWVHRPLTRSNRELAEEIAEVNETVADADAVFVQQPMPVDHAEDDPAASGVPDMVPTLYTLLTDDELSADPILTRGLLEEHALHAQLVQQAAEIAERTGVRLVSFGHTHVPAAVPLDGDAVYLNTGTWTWEINLSGHPSTTWRRLIRDGAAEMMEYHLTYARIDYTSDGEPVGTLRERLGRAGAEQERADSADEEWSSAPPERDE